MEDQGKEQIKAIHNQEQVKKIKKYTCNDKDRPSILKQKEIFNKLVEERLEEIINLDEKVNPDNLIYRYKDPNADVKFNDFDNALDILNKVKEGEISLAHAENDQIKFKSSLGEQKNRSKEQKNIQYNIKILYKARNNVIKFLMIILQWYLKQNMKLQKVKELKYKLLNKCFKDYKKLLHK